MARLRGGGTLTAWEVIAVTTFAPETHVHRPHVNLWLVAVIVLGAARVTLGAWVLVQGRESRSPDELLVDKSSRDSTQGTAKRGGTDRVLIVPVAKCSASEIHVMNADGTGVMRLTHNRLGEGSPAWQPHGLP